MQRIEKFMTVARALRVCQTFPPEREVPSSMMFAITEYEPNTKHNVTAKKKKHTKCTKNILIWGVVRAQEKGVQNQGQNPNRG